MAVKEAAVDHIITPDPAEETEMRRLEQEINEIVKTHGRAKLVGPDGEEVPIPQSAFTALAHAARDMASGKTIMLMPRDKELTTQQAAELLNVSRPYLVRLLDAGAIPSTKTGSHRRVLAEDVISYRRTRALERRARLRE